MADSPVLVWLRSDLRSCDNPALYHACQSGSAVIALYLLTPSQWEEHDVAPIQVDLIRRRLLFLSQELANNNIPLLLRFADTFDEAPAALLDVVEEFNVKQIYWNRQQQWNETQRDNQVELALKDKGLSVHQYQDGCVLAPGTVRTQKGESFRVFTPFRNAWLKVFKATMPQVLPASRSLPSSIGADVLPDDFRYPLTDSSAWPVDDEAIKKRLRQFCVNKAPDYHYQRDYPAVDGTSSLSPYLAIGALSPLQCLASLMERQPLQWDKGSSGAFAWLNELVWRDFYRHLLVKFDCLSRGKPFLEWSSQIPWREDPVGLKAWQQGLTGFPIVDAGMRQLKQTGWMHNRLRMIVASFLTKDLLVHWRQGEQWFMRHLIDGDLAANNGGWQWAASTGTDPQPYFRIFNPTSQGQKYDPDGHFVRRWVPELAQVPNKFIHTPHQWADAEQLAYPSPIVDHSAARLRAIDAFTFAKKQQEAVS